jgi:hypothetical protein
MFRGECNVFTSNVHGSVLGGAFENVILPICLIVNPEVGGGTLQPESDSPLIDNTVTQTKTNNIKETYCLNR